MSGRWRRCPRLLWRRRGWRCMICEMTGREEGSWMYARYLLESGNVIKANPFLASYRILRFAMFFIAILMLALIIFFLIIDTLFGGGRLLLYFTFQFTPILILQAFQLTLYTLQGRYWEGIERRRFAAVQGNQLFL